MNATNSSILENVVDFCRSVTVENMCGQPVWEEIVLAVNIIAIVVNILHYITLQVARKTSEVSQANNSAWQKLLNQFAITDAACGFSGLMRACIFRRLVYGKSLRLGAVITFLSDISVGVRYYVLALACYDRCVAIRWPFRYSTDILIVRINTVCAIFWFWSAATIIVRDILFLEEICINDFVGVTNLYTENLLATAISFTVITPPALVIIVLTVTLLIELHKMRIAGASQTTGMLQIQQRRMQRITNKATFYTAVNSIIFIACLMPLIITSCLVAATDILADMSVNSYNNVLYSGILLTFMFGILNTVLYGWLNKRYRVAFVTLITAGKFNKNQVTGAATVGQGQQ